ncbi:MAG: Uma2 family endonuclease [Chloroflexi bacterium]|nr:Uma2 family endonuclease [Chloroflexota bacterium]
MALRPWIKFTYEDYRNLPESETKRYELLEGELVMVPSPTTYHQRILGRLHVLLAGFVNKNSLGEVFVAPFDIVLSADTVLQPDILFVSNGRASIITPENIRGAPDLVIEVLSPATAERDRIYKRSLYARYGVKEYWIVDPSMKTIEVMELERTGPARFEIYREIEKQGLESPLLKGLTIPLVEIFRE